jgi:hypothetical protein
MISKIAANFLTISTYLVSGSLTRDRQIGFSMKMVEMVTVDVEVTGVSNRGFADIAGETIRDGTEERTDQYQRISIFWLTVNMHEVRMSSLLRHMPCR